MKRSKHSLSYTKLLSCDLGELIPIGLTEILPGDSFRHMTSALIRFSPMLAPPMHPMNCFIHHWFVPHRLVWDDWEDFITGGPDGNNASVFPTITFGGGSGAAIGSLADYLGVPTGVNNIVVSALPFRGYGLIFNEWYRDQDLQTPLTIDTSDGPDTTTNVALQNVCWEKDYFTTSRPWEQKGPDVSVPVGGTAPILASGPLDVRGFSSGGTRTFERSNASASTALDVVEADSGQIPIEFEVTAAEAESKLTADLAGASSVSVNTLRQALAMQRFQEANARYGNRYPEYLARMGVLSPDGRLQRPEYCGGGRQTIQFSEVLQTAEGTDPVGALKGHGIAAARSNRYERFFLEHGYMFSFMSIKPKTIYADGLFRHWNRRTRFDFWQRELEHIGQQQVLNKEVYAAHATPDGIFGYQDRYDEYRRSESLVSGEFRDTLDFWHFARLFASAPALNSTFVSSVPAERPFAVPSEDVVYCHVRHSIQARRLISSRGNSFTF